jgi:hypothetical protein
MHWGFPGIDGVKASRRRDGQAGAVPEKMRIDQTVQRTVPVFCNFPDYLGVGALKNQVQHISERMLHGEKLPTVEY